VGFTGLNAMGHGSIAAGFYPTLLDSHDHFALAIIVIGIVTMIVAAAYDISSGTHRDWLHWSGVAAWLGLSGMQVATILFNWVAA
jgi:hypothetical protein